jgi:hypothetical protein
LGAGFKFDGVDPAVGLGVETVPAFVCKYVGRGVLLRKHATELADAYVESVAGCVGVIIGPEDVYQLVRGDDVVAAG